MSSWETLITIVLGSNVVLSLIQFFITRHFTARDTVKKTLAAFTYFELSSACEHRIERGYASKGHRREIQILYEAYKLNGWNGDMDDLVDKVYDLPMNPDKKLQPTP